MAVDFTLKQDDQLPEIQAVLKDDNDSIVNLSGILGIRFIMKDAAGTIKVDSPAAVVNAVAGLVKYSWEETDTDTAGSYSAEWEVQFADGKLESFPNFKNLKVKIFADLGGVR